MKTIRMELARNHDNPEGNPGDAYELHATLTSDNRIDFVNTDEQLMTFVRYRPGDAVLHGQLVKTDNDAWAFSYEVGDDDDEEIVSLERRSLTIGDYISVIQEGQNEHIYRVASVSDHPVVPA